ncbi:MAG TPA: sigma-70 family RNA polymerase sigma factor, partial [Puia sp.]|nr:sigma-70 family RNA polymerase sigma factor [Puia sp.]
LRRNDLKAFEYLYLHSRNRLYVLALSILRDEDTARDLVQDLFIDLWYFRTLESVAVSVSAYLFQATRNRAYNLRDKMRTRDKLEEAYIPPSSETRYPLENEELGQIIHKAIDRLPPVAGKVFRMQYIDKLTHVEIAEKLGISKYTVSSHIDRALKELRANLKKAR